MKAVYVMACAFGVMLIIIAYAFNWDNISLSLDFLLSITGALVLGWGIKKYND